MDALNTILREKAIGEGLCRQWQSEWNRDMDKDELVEMFQRGQDFCVEHDYPSLDFIRENFTEDELARNNVYLDFPVSGRIGNGTYIFLGECGGEVRVRRWCAATLWVRHECRIKVVAEEFSKVFIRLYDNAEVEVDKSEDSKVRIFDRR